jgi:FkbM family methyltransferase
MRTGLSKPILRLVHSVPAVASAGLYTLSRLFPRLRGNWVVHQVALATNCRIAVRAELGEGIPLYVIWTDYVGRSIQDTGYYDLPTVNIFKKFLKRGEAVLDVGAQVGQFTLIAALAGCTVHSFEPDSQTFRTLQKNVGLNHFHNVRLNQCAVSSQVGEVSFYPAHAQNIGAGSLRYQGDCLDTPCRVKCTSLDEYLRREPVESIGAIKIDVQGAEIDVLKGARQTLLRFSPPIVVEFCSATLSPFGKTLEDLERELRNSGYTLYRITQNGVVPYIPKDPEDYFFDVLALPHSAAD